MARVPLDGGAVETAAYVYKSGPSKIYLTEDAIYFTALVDGNVYRVAR